MQVSEVQDILLLFAILQMASSALGLLFAGLIWLAAKCVKRLIAGGA